MVKEKISCICLTCGVRNDHSSEIGYCQNNHDNWLEYRDVISKNEHFKKACKIFRLTEESLTDKFLDRSILQIEVCSNRSKKSNPKLRPNQFLLPSGQLITEQPILFQTEMVQAILEDRKTQTRRTKGLDHVPAQDFSHVEYSPECWVKRPWVFRNKIATNPDRFEIKAAAKCHYGKPGDLLWVKETWTPPSPSQLESALMYRADFPIKPLTKIWNPSIHLPKAVSRIWAMVEEIRVERVQDISEEDAKKEGVIEFEDGTFKNYFTKKGLRSEDGVECLLAKGSFQSLWCSINGLESWDANPWVWRIQFRVLSKSGRPPLDLIQHHYQQVTSL